MLFDKIELEDSEQVLKIVRKHWFLIVAELFGVFMMILLPLILLSIAVIVPALEPYLNLLPLIIVAMLGWVLLALLTGFMIWTHYYLDLWVITDRRIIVIDQIHFFNRKVSSFRLERLQDIKVTINGIIPTFLNFGTLRAQTAGAADSNFMSTGLPEPRELQALIQKATDGRLEYLHHYRQTN